MVSGLNEMGIYRVAGESSDVEAIRRAHDKGELLPTLTPQSNIQPQTLVLAVGCDTVYVT